MRLITRATLLLLSVIVGLNACQQRPAADKTVPTEQPAPPQPVDAATACVLSQIAYAAQPQAVLDTALPGWKIAWNPEPVNGVYAFVATDSRRFAVCIRGSLIEFSWDAFDNWVFHDLNIAEQEKWPYADSGFNAKVSRGAWLGLSNLNKLKDRQTGNDLLSFLKDHAAAETPLLVTGHSLGGNLATVCATYLRHQLQQRQLPVQQLNVITFAAPAAGNEDFAANYNRWFPASIRFENRLDMVARFPCTGAVGRLGSMFDAAPHADSITVGYQGLSTSLSNVFKTVKGALWLLELKNGGSAYTQTNGNGTVLNGRLSGANAANDIGSWFAEAGGQHGIAQYAKLMGVKVLAL